MPRSPCVPSTADHPQRPRSHQHVLSEVPKCAFHARSCEIYWEELKVALNPRLRIFLSFSLLLIISSCRGQCALFSPHVQPGSHLSTPHICHFFYTGKFFESYYFTPKKLWKTPTNYSKKCKICSFSRSLWYLWQIWGMHLRDINYSLHAWGLLTPPYL